ncbi:MAG: hypothetical protein EB078_03360, partial [Proteobacteria bacterium]|nr:hypothetical protein [Pseudomonadota bacterium]
MTGFGRSEKSFKSYQLNLEIKSVNHRFLDLRFRLPAMASGLETELSDHIRKFCERGSLDISLREKTASGKNATLNKTRFFLDKPALESLMDCVQKAEKITRQNLP